METANMKPDRPIQSKSEDQFEREDFAQHVAQCLLIPKNSPSIVVGLEGKWGEGKTSCINLICQFLKNSEKKPIIVHYSPWLISNLDSLIEGFFIQLAVSIGTKSKTIIAKETSKKILEFAKLLTPIKLIPGVEPWGTIIQNTLKSLSTATNAGANLLDISLEHRKEKIQEDINKLNKAIVVVIDDIDRLPPEQITIIFQLLKAVANFSNVSYLVAYDQEPVAQALSYNNIYNGINYLEKIIQVSFKLPRLSVLHKRKMLLSEINNLLLQHNINHNNNEESLINTLINHTDFLLLIKTPRDIIRLFNRLQLTIKLSNEVCFADMLAFELIDIKYPEITNIIRRMPEYFVNVNFTNSEISTYARNSIILKNSIPSTETNDLLDNLKKDSGLSDIQFREISLVLTYLFPKLSGNRYHYYDDDHQLRAHSYHNLLKLLHYKTMVFTYSNKTAKDFLTNQGDRLILLEDWHSQNILDSWMGYIEIFLDTEIIPDIEELSIQMLEFFKNKTSFPKNHDLTNIFGYFIIRLLCKLPNNNSFYKALETLLKINYSLATTEQILIILLKDATIWNDRKYNPNVNNEIAENRKYKQLTNKQLYKLKDIWLQSVREYAIQNDIIRNQYNPITILYRWGQLNNNDFTEVQDYLRKYIHDEKWVNIFVSFVDPERMSPDFLANTDIEQIQKLTYESTKKRAMQLYWLRLSDDDAEKI